jgi:hypothetical protein
VCQFIIIWRLRYTTLNQNHEPAFSPIDSRLFITSAFVSQMHCNTFPNETSCTLHYIHTENFLEHSNVFLHQSCLFLNLITVVCNCLSSAESRGWICIPVMLEWYSQVFLVFLLLFCHEFVNKLLAYIYAEAVSIIILEIHCLGFSHIGLTCNDKIGWMGL